MELTDIMNLLSLKVSLPVAEVNHVTVMQKAKASLFV